MILTCVTLHLALSLEAAGLTSVSISVDGKADNTAIGLKTTRDRKPPKSAASAVRKASSPSVQPAGVIRRVGKTSSKAGPREDTNNDAFDEAEVEIEVAPCGGDSASPCVDANDVTTIPLTGVDSIDDEIINFEQSLTNAEKRGSNADSLVEASLGNTTSKVLKLTEQQGNSLETAGAATLTSSALVTETTATTTLDPRYDTGPPVHPGSQGVQGLNNVIEWVKSDDSMLCRGSFVTKLSGLPSSDSESTCRSNQTFELQEDLIDVVQWKIPSLYTPQGVIGVGFDSGPSEVQSTSYTDIDFFIGCSQDGLMAVYEAGVLIKTGAACQAARGHTLLEVKIDGAVVKYFYHFIFFDEWPTLFHTSSNSPQFPLHAAVYVNSTGYGTIAVNLISEDATEAPTLSPTPLPTSSPTPAPTFASTCKVAVYEHWPTGMQAGIPDLADAERAWKHRFPTGRSQSFEGLGDKKISQNLWAVGVSSVRVEGQCCSAQGYLDESCSTLSSNHSIGAVSSQTNLFDPSFNLVGVVTPAFNLKRYWGCNDCTKCIRVTQTCSMSLTTSNKRVHDELSAA